MRTTLRRMNKSAAATLLAIAAMTVALATDAAMVGGSTHVEADTHWGNTSPIPASTPTP